MSLYLFVATLVALAIPVIALGCFLYRNRGRSESAGNTTEARLFFWAFPVGIIMAFICQAFGEHTYLAIASLLLAWGGISIGHSFAQSPGATQYFDMGLIGYTRMGAILLPLIYGARLEDCSAILYTLIFTGFGCVFASWLSYTRLFQTRTLTLGGIQWCAPGDSTWEEFLLGGVYFCAFYGLFIYAILRN